MKDYTVYKIATGEIQRRITCPEGHHRDNLFGDEDAVEGRYDADRYTIVAGVPTLKDPAP